MKLLIAAVVLAAGGAVLLAKRKDYRLQNLPPYVPYLAFAAAAVALLASCFTIIPSGHVGVKVFLGNVRPGFLAEGPHLVNPLLDIEPMTVRTQAYTMSGTAREGEVQGDDSIEALSKDGLQLALDVTVTYKMLAEDAAWVYQKLGPDYTEKIIRPAVRTALREAASEIDSSQAYAEKRKDLADKAATYLKSRLAEILQQSNTGKSGLKLQGQAFVIQQVLLRNVGLPSRQRQAIETKLAMEQSALQKEFEIQREKKEKERKVIEGEGIAERMAKIKKELTPELLRFEGIEATRKLAESPNAKTVIIGGTDGLPIILNTDATK